MSGHIEAFSATAVPAIEGQMSGQTGLKTLSTVPCFPQLSDEPCQFVARDRPLRSVQAFSAPIRIHITHRNRDDHAYLITSSLASAEHRTLNQILCRHIKKQILDSRRLSP